MMVGRKRPRRASFALTDEDLYHDDDVADGNPSNESVLNAQHHRSHHDPSPPPSSPPRNNNRNNNNKRSRSRQNGFKRQMLDVWASCSELLQLASTILFEEEGSPARTLPGGWPFAESGQDVDTGADADGLDQGDSDDGHEEDAQSYGRRAMKRTQRTPTHFPSPFHRTPCGVAKRQYDTKEQGDTNEHGATPHQVIRPTPMPRSRTGSPTSSAMHATPIPPQRRTRHPTPAAMTGTPGISDAMTPHGLTPRAMMRSVRAYTTTQRTPEDDGAGHSLIRPTRTPASRFSAQRLLSASTPASSSRSRGYRAGGPETASPSARAFRRLVQERQSTERARPSSAAAATSTPADATTRHSESSDTKRWHQLITQYATPASFDGARKHGFVLGEGDFDAFVRYKENVHRHLQQLSAKTQPTMTPHTPAVARGRFTVPPSSSSTAVSTPASTDGKGAPIIEIEDESELEQLTRQHQEKCQRELLRQRKARRQAQEAEEARIMQQLQKLALARWHISLDDTTQSQDALQQSRHLLLHHLQSQQYLPSSITTTTTAEASPLARSPEEVAREAAKERAFLQDLRERLRSTIETPFYDEIFLFKGKTLKEAIDQLHHQVTFPPVPDRARAQVEDAMDPLKGNASDLLAELRGQPVTRRDMLLMRDRALLNDEIMNHYMQLVVDRADAHPDKYPSVFAFNTFFFSKLKKEGYSSVRRWTRKTDIFQKDYILVPIHLTLHWTMAVINMKDRVIEYYDSLHGNEPNVFALLKHYIEKEHETKKPPSPLDLSEWTTFYADECPVQQNGYDCGIFACQFGEYRSRGDAALAFDQRNMLYFREKMVWEILSGRLLL